MPLLLLVNGPPAAGKSTIARRLAAELGLPLIAKDDLKVILYESYGWGGRAKDRAASDAAYELIYHLARVQLSSGGSLILESNFRPEAGPRLHRLQVEVGFTVVQVRCVASREVLIGRLNDRVARADRHPGHADAETLTGELEGLLASGSALDLEGALIEIDTTEPEAVDFGALLEAVRRSTE